MTNRRLFLQTFGLLVVIFLLHLGATRFDWYWQISWFDLLMHTLGGAFVALATVLCLGTQFRSTTARLWGPVIGALVVGLGWEVFEIVGDEWITRTIGFASTFPMSGDLTDTLTDLLSDIIGAAGIALLLVRSWPSR